MTYRTEIHVSEDRYVCLQLPDFVPSGRATVTVTFSEPADEDAELNRDEDDHDDIEWWDDHDG